MALFRPEIAGFVAVNGKTNGTKIDEFNARLRATWLKWGLIPLAVGIVLTLMACAAAPSPDRFTDRALELRFQIVLAIGAGLFLVAFSLDNHWTNAQKLARRIAAAAGVPAADATPDGLKTRGRKLSDVLATRADIASEHILTSTQALTIIGAGIVAVAILAGAAGLGFSYASMLLLLAAFYQLFVLSRHPYYKEVLLAAEAGELVIVDPKHKHEAAEAPATGSKR